MHAVPNNLKKKGYICEISVVDRCLLFPCLNSGTCTSIGCQRKCQCMGGYMGENCENNVCDSSPCTNGGTCELSTKEPYYTCVCQPEYRGTQCKNIRLFHDTTNNCKYHVNLYDKKSFVETNLTCSSLGGAIAMMKTTEIQDLVESQIIKQYGATGEALEFWIGGFKVSNSWIWVDGTDVPTTGKDSKWPTNHHTSTGSMILSPHGSDRENMMWFAKPNYRKRGYIGEISEYQV
uniref:protein crumbs-like n=1 Tax=Styela clava TaxID=7725 RepID=UPI0019392E17|nr:protein crumbs-like [Styela clava]